MNSFFVRKGQDSKASSIDLANNFSNSLNCLLVRASNQASTLRTLLFAQSDFEYSKVFQITPVTNKQIALKLTSNA